MLSDEYRIIVKTGNVDTWIDFLNRSRYSPDKAHIRTLHVDFFQANFVEPHHLVSLACLIEDYHTNGVEIRISPGSYGVKKYLDNIRFCEYWTAGFDRNAFTDAKIDTALNLWKVHREMIDTYPVQAQQYFQSHFFENKDLSALNRSLSELFNNIYDHAQSPVGGYVLTQYYPNKGVIVTAVCDFGIGIPAKINKIWTGNNKSALDEQDALRAAFITGVSSKSTPRNRGFGLPNLLSNAQSLRGEIEVYSNNAKLRQQNHSGLHTYSTNNNFAGTLISIKLNTDYLPEEEEVENDEFFF